MPDRATHKSYSFILSYYGLQARKYGTPQLEPDDKICVVQYAEKYKDLQDRYPNTIFIVVTDVLLDCFDPKFQYIGQWKAEQFGGLLMDALKRLPKEAAKQDFIRVGSWRYYKDEGMLVRGHYSKNNLCEPNKWYLRLLDLLIEKRTVTHAEIMEKVFYDRPLVLVADQVKCFKRQLDRCPNCRVVTINDRVYFTERWMWMRQVGAYRHKTGYKLHNETTSWLGVMAIEEIERAQKTPDKVILAHMWDEEVATLNRP